MGEIAGEIRWAIHVPSPHSLRHEMALKDRIKDIRLKPRACIRYGNQDMVIGFRHTIQLDIPLIGF